MEPPKQFSRDDGAEAAFLAAQYGLIADDWQEDILKAWFARGKDGKLLAKRAGLSIPRQNGKNALLEIAELFKLVVEHRSILHTAHEVKTAKEAFDRIRSFFDPNYGASDEMVALVRKIRDTNGQEAIWLKCTGIPPCTRGQGRKCRGAAIRFVARSRGSGRGFTADDLIFDEAQELQDAHIAAQMPVLSASKSGDSQVIFTGTPPPPGADGEPYRRLRDQALKGKSKTIAWHEWSPVKLPEPTDRKACLEAALDTNPAAGTRLALAAIAEEYDALSGAAFAQERLGSWDERARPSLIPKATWAALVTDSPPSDGVTVFAVKFAKDGDCMSIGGARRNGGNVFVESFGIADLSGQRAAVEWLTARADTTSLIAVDGKGSADNFIADLIGAGFARHRIRRTTASEYYAAHSALILAIGEQTISHSGQKGLAVQVQAAGKRVTASEQGGWLFTPVTPGADLTALQAVMLAHYYALTARARSVGGRSTGSRTTRSR